MRSRQFATLMLVSVAVVLPLIGCVTIPASRSLAMGSSAEFGNGEMRPPTAQTLYAMARLLSGQGRQNEAESVLLGINREYPKFLPAYADLAELRLNQNRNRDALDALRSGLRIEPKNPTLLNNAGLCRLLLKDYAGALRDFSRAADIRPRNSRYRANLALALGLLGRERDSQAHYQRVITDEAASFNLAAIAEVRGFLPQSRDKAEAEVQGPPLRDPLPANPVFRKNTGPNVRSNPERKVYGARSIPAKNTGPNVKSNPERKVYGARSIPATVAQPSPVADRRKAGFASDYRRKDYSVASTENTAYRTREPRSTLISIERDGQVVTVFEGREILYSRPPETDAEPKARLAEAVRTKRAPNGMKALVQRLPEGIEIATSASVPTLPEEDETDLAVNRREDDSLVVPEAGAETAADPVIVLVGSDLPESDRGRVAPSELSPEKARTQRGSDTPASPKEVKTKPVGGDRVTDAIRPTMDDRDSTEDSRVVASERPVISDFKLESELSADAPTSAESLEAGTTAPSKGRTDGETDDPSDGQRVGEDSSGQINPLLAESTKPSLAGEAENPEKGDTNTSPVDDSADDPAGLAIGEKAPAIYRLDVRARPRPLNVLRGKVVVVSFLRHGTEISEALYPQLRKLAKRHEGDTFHMLGVGSGAGRRELKKIVEAEGMHWPVAWDETIRGRTAERWKVTRWPSTFVVDPKGVVRFKNLTGESLDDAVQSLLDEIDP